MAKDKDLSIEEINKTRAALGMSLIPTGAEDTTTNLAFKPSASSDDENEEPASTLETRAAAAHDNWQKLQDDADAAAKREAKREKFRKERDAAQRVAKLEGKGLGEGDDDDDEGARAWLLGQKKRQKKISRQNERTKKAEEELAERERELRYTESDLAGKRVGHEMSAFDDAGEQILTLKDANVEDDEEEDELENVGLREKERITDRLDLKKGRTVYDPIADEEAGRANFLSQYDEKERHQFTLDGSGRTVEETTRGGAAGGKDEGPKGVKINLAMFRDDKPTSDYQDISEVKIPKPKKKKKDKSKRKRGDAGEDDGLFEALPEVKAEDDGMDVELPPNGLPMTRIKRTYDESLLDDNDLQSTLALQRRDALKKRKVKRAEELTADYQKEESATPSAYQMDVEEADESGIVLDETSEFVTNFDADARELKKARRRSDSTPAVASPDEEDEDDVDMDQVYNDIDDDEDLRARLKREHSSQLPQGETSIRNSAQDAMDEEGGVAKGVGGTLKMLMDRGILQRNDESAERNADYRRRQDFLREKQMREDAAERAARAQREADRHSGKFANMSARDREKYAQQRNEERDQHDSRRMAESFNREYKPDIELKYVDEFGRRMTQREAFKHLSHQFHGKGSGKQKTEKRLKKIEDEKKRMAQSSLDTNKQTGINRAMGATAKKTQTAGVRLQ